jgi:hypothetical protein
MARKLRPLVQEALQGKERPMDWYYVAIPLVAVFVLSGIRKA